jgi:hypothetical protein
MIYETSFLQSMLDISRRLSNVKDQMDNVGVPMEINSITCQTSSK